MSLSPGLDGSKSCVPHAEYNRSRNERQFLTGNSIGHGHSDRRLNRTMRFGRAAKGVSDARVVPRCCICDVRQGAPIVGERPLWGMRHISDRRTRSLTSLGNLHLGLLGNLQRIVDLDAEIPNCAFEFRVPEQQLNSSEISSSLIDHRSFRTSQRMRAV